MNLRREGEVPRCRDVNGIRSNEKIFFCSAYWSFSVFLSEFRLRALALVHPGREEVNSTGPWLTHSNPASEPTFTCDKTLTIEETCIQGSGHRNQNRRSYVIVIYIKIYAHA